MGINNIILYDNNDSDGEDLYEVIGDDISSGYIIYHNVKDNHKHNRQLIVYKHCFDTYKNQFD